MQDILLEPFGGQVFGLPVGDTTLLMAALAGGMLIGFFHCRASFEPRG